MNEKKFLVFKRKDCNIEEYGVWNKKNQFLGDIVKKRTKWIFYPDYMCAEGDIWFASGCLKQISEYLDKLTGDLKEEIGE